MTRSGIPVQDQLSGGEMPLSSGDRARGALLALAQLLARQAARDVVLGRPLPVATPNRTMAMTR